MNAVVRLSRSTVIDAPVDAIWRLLRDFNSHGSWHPAIADSRIEAGETNADVARRLAIDPTTVGLDQPNNTYIAANIRRSFRVFRDDNHDGRGDHEHQGQD